MENKLFYSEVSGGVNVRKQFFRVSELIEISETKMKISDEKLVNPNRFMDSVLRLIPTQSFYLDGSSKDWRLIDGNKRLNAIIDFIKGDFCLELDLWNHKINGKKYDEIEGWMRSRIKDFQIEAHVVNPCPKEIADEFILRINGKSNL